MAGSAASIHRSDDSSAADMKATIDGLIAVVSYSDETNRHSKLQRDPSVSTSRLGFSNLPNQQNQPPVNARLFGESEYTVEKSSQRGWELLRCFEQKTDEVHAKLREHLISHNCSFIRRWLDFYESPARLRLYGLLVLRDMYCDKLPSCSLGSFAAMIVQHSIRDISLYKTDVSDSAVFGWKEILLTPTEREELSCFYDQLWQQDNSNLIVSQGTAQAQSSVPASYLQVGGQFNSEPQPPIPVDTSLGYFEQYVSPLPQPQPNLPGLGNEDLRLWYDAQNPDYDFQQESGPYSFGFSQNELRSLHYTSDYIPPSFNPSFPIPFSSNTAPGFPSPMQPVNSIGPSPVSPQISSNHHQRSSYPTRSSARPDDTALALKQSRPFQIFIRFLEDFGKSETLLDIFSIKSSTPSPKDSSDRLMSSFARHRHSEFTKDIQHLLFDSLPSSSLPFSRDPVINGIIAAAKFMVSLGNLQCLRDVEEYLTILGQTLISTPQTLKQFAEVMLTSCLEISAKPGYRQFCYSQVEVDQEYSPKYLEARLKRLSIRDHQPSTITPGEYAEADSLSAYSKSRNTPSRPRSISFPSGSQGTSGSVVFASETPDEVKSQSNSVTPSQDAAAAAADWGAPKRCGMCGKAFTGRWAGTSLSRHVRTNHSDRVYKCPYCDKPDRRSCNLGKHIEKVHRGMLIPKFGAKGTERLPHSHANAHASASG